MSMPHLTFLDIWGSSFKSFKKSFKFETQPQMEDLRLKIPAKLFLQSSIFNLRFEVEFQI